MIPNLIIAAFVGWCGTYWPHWPRLPGGTGGGGGFDPDNPWPPNCPMCGQIIGAISAVILAAVLEKTIEGNGLFGLMAISFFAGSFGSNFVGNLRGLMTRG
jgi:hypothetical protein